MWSSTKASSRKDPNLQTHFTTGDGTENNSQEFILQPLGDRQITKTTDVRVDYENQERDLSSDRAMHGNPQFMGQSFQ